MTDRIKPRRAGAYIVRSIDGKTGPPPSPEEEKARRFAQSVREARDAAWREGAFYGFLAGLVVGAIAGVLL